MRRQNEATASRQVEVHRCGCQTRFVVMLNFVAWDGVLESRTAARDSRGSERPADESWFACGEAAQRWGPPSAVGKRDWRVRAALRPKSSRDRRSQHPLYRHCFECDAKE